MAKRNWIFGRCVVWCIKTAVIDFFDHMGAVQQAMTRTLTNYQSSGERMIIQMPIYTPRQFIDVNSNLGVIVLDNAHSTLSSVLVSATS